jgi:hypothetical protein
MADACTNGRYVRNNTEFCARFKDNACFKKGRSSAMTSSNLEETAFLPTLDKLVEGLDTMLDDLSRLIYTMSRQGQETANPLVLYRALVETANQAKTLRSQEIEALYIGTNKALAVAGTGSQDQA